MSRESNRRNASGHAADREQRRSLKRNRGGGGWRWFSIALGLVAAGAYAANLVLDEPSPASVWGLAYGIAATLLLAVTALYGVRRRAMRLVSRHRLGSASAWLALHLYGGGLFLLLVLMHSGFRFPTGTLTRWLWILSLWTVASGLLGLMLQRWIPKVLASGLSIEVLYERIPELIDDIRRQAERLVATCEEPVQALYARQVAPALAGPDRRLIYYLDITGGIRSRLREFRYLGRLLESEQRGKLDQLEHLYKAKLEIDAHYTLQRALRLWLYAHLPFSIVLVALVLLHLFTVFYY